MFTMPETVQILATSDEEAVAMTESAEMQGSRVTTAHVWTGIIPPNSFMEIAPNARMSTPEFFFFRKANCLPSTDAVKLGNELCGFYATGNTRPDLPEWYVEPIATQRTTKEKLADYLAPVADTDEGKHALAILDDVIDGLKMP